MLLCKVIEKEPPALYRPDSDILTRKESSRSHLISRNVAPPLRYNSSAMNTERICADSLNSKLQLQVPFEEDETHDS
jgi:hypothetical protein